MENGEHYDFSFSDYEENYSEDVDDDQDITIHREDEVVQITEGIYLYVLCYF